MEEERRICYVAITRAEELLYITNATTRMLFGRSQSNMPSRFLKEIPEDLLDSHTGQKDKLYLPNLNLKRGFSKRTTSTKNKFHHLIGK